jgi:hypothetical protein
MSNTIAHPVTMESFQTLGVKLSPEVTLCVRGRHAVGKSEGVYQIAKKLRHDFYKSDEWARIKADPKNNLPFELKDHKYEDGVPVIERRLSQMTEGDIVGLPFMQKNNRTGSNSTSFEPCDWLMLATEFPVLLFLDERNRALEGVKQAVFQLTDSKAFYGKRLHEGTRIIVAENTGDSYQVEQCDPAEVSRCVTVQLEPSVDEFLNYAKNLCNDATIEFIREHGVSVLEHLQVFESNKKYPDRRAWVKLDSEISKMELWEDPANPIFYTVCCAFIGTETGSRFATFVRNRDRNVSAKDILKDWDKALKKLRGGKKDADVSNQTYIACAGKIADYLEKLNAPLTDEESVNLAKFMWDIPSEPRLTLFSKMTKRTDLLLKVHRLIKPLILGTGNGNDVTSIPKPPELLGKAESSKDSSSAATPDPTPRKRGGRR